MPCRQLQRQARRIGPGSSVADGGAGQGIGHGARRAVFATAGDAMGRAGDALGEQQGERAVGEQGQALEALRSGAPRNMMQQNAAGHGRASKAVRGKAASARRAPDRDPLGRPRANTGPDFGESVRVPQTRSTPAAQRRILDGDPVSRSATRSARNSSGNYIERLIEMR